ncbi:acyltransferase family protein [Butyrivibrio sp. AE3003]|uniref:acyltransferase family protein n=1 Tax=Butyrivibrio sp. AE3003 TaxID=1496721 RepID=UPI00047BEB2A
MNANYASDRQTYHHLNGMKGIACFFVLVGHYLGIYKYSQSFIPSICCFDIINDSHFAIFLDEGYWLYLFFVISGYLVSRSNIYNIKELLCRIVIRFFRLACPILFSHFIIYFIYRTVGFHNGETTTLFQCEWFQQIFYTRDFTIKDVLISPFSVLIFGNSDMNKPYWVLQMMFFFFNSYISNCLLFHEVGFLAKRNICLCFIDCCHLIIFYFSYYFSSFDRHAGSFL